MLIVAVVSYIYQENRTDHFSESVKIALRDSGNKLLLSNKDSTSLVEPVIQLEKNKYQLSFETHLSISPDTLVTTISNSFEVTNLPNNYIVEVIDCTKQEVSYSYQIMEYQEKNIVPCLGRNLPLNCYTINVLFTNNKSSFLASYKKYGLLLLILISFIGFAYQYIIKNKNQKQDDDITINYTKLGHYKFYKDQHKLVRENQVIKLTTKECELIKIFSQNQNQIVKRDQLIKEVWEDNGVFVGRSLDAFISRIRKKFNNDPSINIVNVHGVGYKLEVS